MAFPTSPTNCQITTVNGIRYSYSSVSNSWTRISSGKFTAAATGPTNPSTGDHWYNTSEDTLYEWTYDGVGYYWLDIQSAFVGGNSGSVLSNTTVAGTLTMTGNIVPSANITYNIGTSTQRFKDLFLSGTTIDIGGATIKTDSGSGAIALIPQPTVANPNPTGIVVSTGGTISTVSTVAGEASLANIGTSANTASTSGSTSFGNITVNGNIISPSSIGAVVSVTGATTLNSNAFGNIHICTGTTADYTITLPPVAGNVGKIITFQMSSALTKLVTLDGNASELIDGSSTRIMWANESAILYCNGTSWNKIGGKTISMIGAITPSATQSISNNTDTKRTGMNTKFGADNNVPGMSDTTNSRVVVQRPSKYKIGVAWRITNIGGTGNMEVRIYVNGAETFINSRTNATGDWPVLQVFNTHNGAVGDYIELYCKHFVGSTQTAWNSTDTFILVEEIPQW